MTAQQFMANLSTAGRVQFDESDIPADWRESPTIVDAVEAGKIAYREALAKLQPEGIIPQAEFSQAESDAVELDRR